MANELDANGVPINPAAPGPNPNPLPGRDGVRDYVALTPEQRREEMLKPLPPEDRLLRIEDKLEAVSRLVHSLAGTAHVPEVVAPHASRIHPDGNPMTLDEVRWSARRFEVEKAAREATDKANAEQAKVEAAKRKPAGAPLVQPQPVPVQQPLPRPLPLA